MLQIIQLISAALGVVLDQWFKKWTLAHVPAGEVRTIIPGIIHLTNIENRGAALSMFTGMRWILLGISVLFAAAAVWAIAGKKIKNPLGSWALAAVLSGAVGNAIDRALTGAVTDMFEFEIVLNFFVFNIADVFITLGGIAFCIYYLIHEIKKKERLPEAADAEDNDKGE